MPVKDSHTLMSELAENTKRLATSSERLELATWALVFLTVSGLVASYFLISPEKQAVFGVVAAIWIVIFAIFAVVFVFKKGKRD